MVAACGIGISLLTYGTYGEWCSVDCMQRPIIRQLRSPGPDYAGVYSVYCCHVLFVLRHTVQLLQYPSSSMFLLEITSIRWAY
jgi:hypothetical protein